MLLKDDSVDMGRLTPAKFRIIQILQRLEKELQYPVIFTSVDDGVHSPNSQHYKGQAVDIRSKHMPYHKSNNAVGFLRNTLGDTFTVLHEYIGQPNEHIHIQLRKGKKLTWGEL